MIGHDVILHPRQRMKLFPTMMAGKHFLKGEKSVLSAESSGEKQKVTKCHQLGQASLCHFFLITCYGSNLMSSTGSCVEHLVPSWCHCFGRLWGLAGGGWPRSGPAYSCFLS